MFVAVWRPGRADGGVQAAVAAGAAALNPMCPLAPAWARHPHPTCLRVQNDIFEWHFVIRGPRDTEFDVGRVCGGGGGGAVMPRWYRPGMCAWCLRLVTEFSPSLYFALLTVPRSHVSTPTRTHTHVRQAAGPANAALGRCAHTQGGIYHGRILLPAEYPFKPPAFMMLTPNGRFETGVKICLSISSHHPEHWQPSWSVRTALTALIAFMPSPGQGALGSLVSKEWRGRLGRGAWALRGPCMGPPPGLA